MYTILDAALDQSDSNSSLDTKTDGYVLVVDDDLETRDMLTAVLDSMHLSHRTCANGLEALDIIYESRPNLILLDLIMPDMDGFSFLSKLRGSNRTSQEIPIIVFSGLSSNARELLKIRGVACAIQKGKGTLKELMTAIETALSLEAKKVA